MTFSQELETLIRARYPIIYVVTSEETRMQKVVVEVAQKREKKAFEWTYSTGIVPVGTSIQTQKHRSAATKDPLLALDQVVEQVDPAVFLFKDFHPFLTKNNFAVIRKLKDIAIQLKTSYKTIVLVSPVLEIPIELEKEITLLNFPAPGRDELATLLESILADVQKIRKVRIDLDDAGRERLLQAALGLTLSEAENVFAKIIVTGDGLDAEDVQAVFAEKQQIIRKSGLLEYYEAQEKFADVAGLENLKDWLQKRSVAFSERAQNALDDRVVHEGPRGIVHEYDEGLLGDVGQRSTHRLGSRRATGDARHDLRRRELLGEKDRRLLPAGRSGDDDCVDPGRAVEPVEALGEQRPPTENGERLRTIDAEPLAGARSEE